MSALPLKADRLSIVNNVCKVPTTEVARVHARGIFRGDRPAEAVSARKVDSLSVGPRL